MFDYVTAQEIQLLAKICVGCPEADISSGQRIRFELLGLITDGPIGIRLTPKGNRVAQSGYTPDEWHQYGEPEIVRLSDQVGPP